MNKPHPTARTCRIHCSPVNIMQHAYCLHCSHQREIHQTHRSKGSACKETSSCSERLVFILPARAACGSCDQDTKHDGTGRALMASLQSSCKQDGLITHGVKRVRLVLQAPAMTPPGGGGHRPQRTRPNHRGLTTHTGRVESIYRQSRCDQSPLGGGRAANNHGSLFSCCCYRNSRAAKAALSLHISAVRLTLPFPRL